MLDKVFVQVDLALKVVIGGRGKPRAQPCAKKGQWQSGGRHILQECDAIPDRHNAWRHGWKLRPASNAVKADERPPRNRDSANPTALSWGARVCSIVSSPKALL